MKRKAGITIIFFLILVSIALSGDIISKTPKTGLEYVHSEVDFAWGCDYYIVHNLDPDNPMTANKINTLKLHSKNTISGSTTNSHWEWKTNETFTTERDLWGVCKKEVPCNGTKPPCFYEYTCKQGTEKITSWRWVWKSEPPKEIPKGGGQEVRFCADIQRTWDPDRGAILEVDHIMEFDGKTFPEWAWWNNSWENRKYVNLTVCSGTTPANYQVKLNVTYEPTMQPDFEDLRFIDNDNSTELDYWYKNYTASINAYVWVEINDAITPAGTLIWMYYSNNAVVNQSNGSATFNFFDDFDGVALDAALWDSSNAPAVGGSWVTLNGNDEGIWTKQQFDNPEIFQFKCNESNEGAAGRGDYWGITEWKAGGPDWGVIHSKHGYYLNDVGGCDTVAARGPTITGNMKEWEIWWANDTSISMHSWSNIDHTDGCSPDGNNDEMIIREWEAGWTTTCDWAFSREFHLCDATAVFGPEQAGNTAPTTPHPWLPPHTQCFYPLPTALHWNASTDPQGDPITYYLQIDDDMFFGSPDQTEHTSLTWNVTQITGNGTWYWRVLASDGKLNSSWCSSPYFTVPCPCPPCPPSGGNVTCNTCISALGCCSYSRRR